MTRSSPPSSLASDASYHNKKCNEPFKILESPRVFWGSLTFGILLLLITTSCLEGENFGVMKFFHYSVSKLSFTYTIEKKDFENDEDGVCDISCCKKDYTSSSPNSPSLPSVWKTDHLENGTKVLLKSYHGKWVGPVGYWSVMDCNRNLDSGHPEPLTVIRTGPDTVHFMTPVGTFLEAAMNSDIIGNATSPYPSTEFRVTQVGSSKVHFQAYDGLYMGCLQGGGFHRWSNKPSAWETFYVEQFSTINSWHGVTLSNWLVVDELMLPPSLQKSIDLSTEHQTFPKGLRSEFKLMRSVGHARATKMLLEHYQNYVTLKDFGVLADHRINSVRIPVGWWVVNFENDAVEWAWVREYVRVLDAAFDHALDNKIGLFVCMYAQPGFEYNPVLEAQPVWGVYPEVVDKFVSAIEWIAKRYGKKKSFLGVSIMHEKVAQGVPQDMLAPFFKNAYKAVREHSPCAYVAMSPKYGDDAYALKSLMEDSRFTNVVFELYFDNNDPVSNGLHVSSIIEDIKTRRLAMIDRLQENGRMVAIAEWSLSFKDELPRSSNDVRNIGSTQLGIYRRAKAGWFFLSHKGSDHTISKSSFVENVEKGFLPRQPNGYWD